MTLEVGPGDVLAVLASDNFFSRLVRFAARLSNKPDLVDHVVIVTHQDEQGRWLGIEGRPGGVGLCDVTPYLNDPRTRSNHPQPRPNDSGQLEAFLASCQRSIGIAYDWVAIVGDAADAFGLHDLSDGIDHLWRWPSSDGRLPGHVVCSSLAAELYRIAGWAHPALSDERCCAPGDWWTWNDSQAWNLTPV
jgi:hypothetical protein